MTMFLHFQPTTRAVQAPEPCKRMTSSRWRVVSRTAATGRQSWDGSTQLTTSLMTTSPWQPAIRRSLHSWRLQRLLVFTALRLFVLLTSLNRHHLCRPQLLTYRVTRTPGRHHHSTYSVSNATDVFNILLLQLYEFNFSNKRKTKLYLSKFCLNIRCWPSIVVVLWKYNMTVNTLELEWHTVERIPPPWPLMSQSC